MALFIELSANHAKISEILDKAKSLKLEVKDAISWDDGFKTSDKSRRNIKVIQHSDSMWKFVSELEPTWEDTKRKRINNGSLAVPTPEETLKYGYKEPKK